MSKKKIKFVDAQKMAKENPDSFYAPSFDELNEIKKGSIVNIAVDGERFWTVVISVKGNKITGTVNNVLVFSDEHGLQFEDEVKFEKKNVYNVFSM